MSETKQIVEFCESKEWKEVNRLNCCYNLLGIIFDVNYEYILYRG